MSNSSRRYKEKGKAKRPRPHGPRRSAPRSRSDKVDKTYGVTVSVGRRYYNVLNNGQLQPSSYRTSALRTNGLSGVQLPSHEARIKSVLPATTPMTANFLVVKSKAFSGKYVRASRYPTNSPLAIKEAYDTGTYSFNYGLSYLPSTPALFSGTAYTTAYNLAVSRLYDALRGFESRANVGEDLGEISQTINLLKKPFSGIQDLLAYASGNHIALLKKARWNNLKQTARGLGSLVTEYQFGIKPLSDSLASAYVSLQNRDRLYHFAPFKASGIGISYSLGKPVADSVGASRVATSLERSTRYKVAFKGMFSAEAAVDKYSLCQSLGLTWGEFVPTLYNLIPYSFLLDYVVNLNQFISTLAVPWGGVRWCNMTERSESQAIIRFCDSPFNVNDIYDTALFSPGYLSHTMVSVRRSDHSSSMPFPQLAVKTPSVGHLANTAALLAANLPVIGRLTRGLLSSPKTKGLDRHFNDVSRDYRLRVPYPKFTF